MTAKTPAAESPEVLREAGQRLKIRFLIANCYGVGGTIKATFDLAGELAKRHDVEIVSVQKSRATPAFLVPAGVRIRPLHDRTKKGLQGGSGKRAFLRRLRSPVKAFLMSRPSRLIHKNDARYQSFSLMTDLRLLQLLRSVDDGILIGTRAGLNLAIARYGRRSVIRIGQEHLNFTRYGAEIRKAFKTYYPRLDAYSTLTEGDAAAFRELLGPEARVVSNPNGIDADGRPQSDTTNKVVLAAGRLTSQKGFDRLVKAWPHVAEKNPGWQLHIYGEGTDKAALEAEISELGISESARLMGYTSRLPELMAEAGFYVLSSRFEGFPVVSLEAMASGLPVVSYDCPTGPAELITPGEDGFLVPNGDVPGLAAAINEMIELGEARSEFGKAARAKAGRYSLETWGRGWETLLLDLAAERAERA